MREDEGGREGGRMRGGRATTANKGGNVSCTTNSEEVRHASRNADSAYLFCIAPFLYCM